MTDKQRLAVLRAARRELERTKEGYNPLGGHWQRANERLDRLENDLRPAPALWANVGPVQPGGKSLLDMSLTHDTSGIPLFPAVDTAWGGGGGVELIAPEGCTVDRRDTSSSPGEAFFMSGRSSLDYWFGHLDRDWPLGHEFVKGDFIGKTLPIPGQSDHAHVGVNAEALLGKGKELLWGGAPSKPRRRYQLGSPTIREQLERLLV